MNRYDIVRKSDGVRLDWYLDDVQRPADPRWGAQATYDVVVTDYTAQQNALETARLARVAAFKSVQADIQVITSLADAKAFLLKILPAVIKHLSLDS